MTIYVQARTPAEVQTALSESQHRQRLINCHICPTPNRVSQVTYFNEVGTIVHVTYSPPPA